MSSANATSSASSAHVSAHFSLGTSTTVLHVLLSSTISLLIVPSIRLALTEDHEPALDRAQFHAAVDRSVRDFYNNENSGWEHSWTQEATAQDSVAYGLAS